MATNLIEHVRQYSASNGGHATNATSAGVSLSYYVDVLNGKQRINSKMAATMAPLIGVTIAALMNENTDLQLALRRNALP